MVKRCRTQFFCKVQLYIEPVGWVAAIIRFGLFAIAIPLLDGLRPPNLYIDRTYPIVLSNQILPSRFILRQPGGVIETTPTSITFDALGYNNQ